MATIVHIGLPRAASTTLQEDIFPRTQGVFYLGRPPLGQGRLSVGQCAKIRKLDATQFPKVAQELRAYIAAAREKISAQDVDLVISSEGWCRPYEENSLEVIAKRLEEVFEDVTILVTLREPLSWFLSCYQKALWLGFNHDRSYNTALTSIDAYYKFIVKNPDKLFGTPGLYPQELIEVFRDTYGKDRVKVLPIEWLWETQFHGLTTLFPNWIVPSSISSPHNASQDPTSLFAAQLWNRLPYPLRIKTRAFVQSTVPTISHKIPWKPKRIEIPDHLRRSIVEAYQPQRNFLQEACGMDLSAYGY